MDDKYYLEKIFKELNKQTRIMEESLKLILARNKDNCGEENTEDEQFDIPELLEHEKTIPFTNVIKDGYNYKFCYGKFIERKKASKSECYMYRNDTSQK